MYVFLIDRLRGLYVERGVEVDLFEAVSTVQPATVSNFDRRIDAVIAFSKLPEAESLSAANKRIRNILRKSGAQVVDSVNPMLFESGEEESLYDRILAKRQKIAPLLAGLDYEATLVELGQLLIDHHQDMETSND